MLSIEEIARTALAEHDDGHHHASGSSSSSSSQDFISRIQQELSNTGGGGGGGGDASSSSSLPFYPATQRSSSSSSSQSAASTDTTGNNEPQLVRFRCMLQDTGYPPEVYMPPPSTSGVAMEEGSSTGAGRMDWSRLKERWVGWAVSIPGEQRWVRESLANSRDSAAAAQSIESNMAGLRLGVDDATESSSSASPSSSQRQRLPSNVLRKFPSSARGPNGASSSNAEQEEAVGMLIKVYDPDASFSPGSVHTFTGLLSTSPIPASSDADDDEDNEQDGAITSVVPCLHVLVAPEPLVRPQLSKSVSRDEAIRHLATRLLSGDLLAAECLLLSLVSRVTGRAPGTGPSGSMPLGSLSLGLLLPKTTAEGVSFDRLQRELGDLLESVVAIPLSLQTLKEASFFPSAMPEQQVAASSSSSSPSSDRTAPTSGLRAGLLQLPPGACLLVDEDALEPGTLDERGVRNLRSLSEVFKSQRLRYAYPYVGEDFGIECDVACIAVGQGKSLLPVDIHVPLQPDAAGVEASSSISQDLSAIRAFIREARQAATNVSIPDDVAEHIQADWVRRRKESGGDANAATTNVGNKKQSVGELDLARWLRMARLMAQTFPDRQLTPEIWQRTVELDEERQRRMAARN